MKSKTLNLNSAEDAREFLLKALPEALPAKPDYVVLESGRKLKFKDMNDSEAIQYAWELLPIFKAAFPDNVDVQYEH